MDVQLNAAHVPRTARGSYLGTVFHSSFMSQLRSTRRSRQVCFFLTINIESANSLKSREYSLPWHRRYASVIWVLLSGLPLQRTTYLSHECLWMSW